MKKIFIYLLTVISAIACVLGTGCKIKAAYPPELKATVLGIGGGGLLFEPTISPFDENTMTVIPDMGGIYVSHNAGVDWKRKNLQGVVQKAFFDPNRKGVVYAGGTGLYRSTDNGDTFNLIFPKHFRAYVLRERRYRIRKQGQRGKL